MSNPNHHNDYATAAFESAGAKADPMFNQEVRSDALIQATLALAYEQRTANLIAFYGDGPKVDAGDPAYAELNRQIVERLGL